MSDNDYLIDASTRHQIMLQRLSGCAFNKLKPILEDVKARLRDDSTDFQMHRLTALSDDIRHGVGVKTWADGNVKLVEYENGKLLKYI